MSSDELIKYRCSRALETYQEALLLSKGNHWNATANRLYYACFYAVNALLLTKGFTPSTHNGVKTEFHKSFIKTSIITKKSGRTFSRLFNLRNEGDYLDFRKLEKEDVESFFPEVEEFISELLKHINYNDSSL